MALLRSLFFYVAFYLGTAWYVLKALASIAISQEQFREAVHGWSRFHRRCVENILGIEIRFEGKPHDEPLLYAIKHESFFEAIDAPTVFKVPSVFAKQELFEIPGWGRTALHYGLVPVERDAGARALRKMIAAAKGHVANGRPLVIFPEGTRVPHESAPPLQSGFAGLYKLVGLPVVPVAVDSGPLYHRLIKRRGKITYKFGEPIPPGLPRAEAEERVHEAINALKSG